MINVDYVNAFFEGVGALTILDNCRVALKDKKIYGISWKPIAFYTLWGFWNIYFYPSVNAMWSFYAGIAVVTSNIIWLIFIIKYWHKS